jgi:hypothetical protein
MYEIRAWWPDSRAEPHTESSDKFGHAVIRALELRRTFRHTTITVITPDSLELVRLWGQPMLDGSDWP